jgi:hypothetical protein
MKKESGKVIFSPSDLIRYLASPLALPPASFSEYAEFNIVTAVRE